MSLALPNVQPEVTRSIMSRQAHAKPAVALTAGLTRNIFFNTVGLGWSVLLAFVTTPYILRGLAHEGYGLFGIVTLLAGYAGLFSGPVATGSVRFLAQAYARRDWPLFRETAIAGVILSAGLAIVGTVIILLAAVPLTELFRVSDSMEAQAVVAFQLAAIGFLLSSVASALESIPAAIRRYDIVNGVKMVVSTLRIGGILLAIWLGQGLLGAVSAQLLANLVALLALLWVAMIHVPRSVTKQIEERGDSLPAVESGNLRPDGKKPTWTVRSLQSTVRQLFTFSLGLFLQQAASRISQQVDRTVIGLFWGAATLTFYTVPLQISDRVPMLVSSLTTALYPLSSEAIGREQLLELQQLYLRAVRLLVWLSAFLATVIVAGAQDLLQLWVGPEFAEQSWFVLAILAIAAVWRTPSTVAFQVYNGLGRSDIGVRLALLYLGGVTALALWLTPRWGINGTAVAVLLATVPSALYADLFTQRTLLQQKNWVVSVLPYAKPWAVASLLGLGIALLPERGSWQNLQIQAGLISCGFLGGLLLLDRSLAWTIWRRLALPIAPLPFKSTMGNR